MGKEKKHRKDKSSKKDKQKHKSEKSHSKRSRHESSSASEAEDMWVEKPAVRVSDEDKGQPSLQHDTPPVSAVSVQREDWMSGADDFSNFARKRGLEEVEKEETEKDREEKRRKAIRAQRELNPYFKDGGSGHPPSDQPTETVTSAPPSRSYQFGDNGANWRMMKLKRVYETAEAEKRSVDDVALERYGSLEDFEDAKEERAFLDQRRAGRGDRNKRDEGYRPTVRSGASFQRPTDEFGRELREEPPRFSRPTEPVKSVPTSSSQTPAKPISETSSSRVPSILPQTAPSRASSTPVLTKDELNKLQAKALKAKLTGLPDAEALEKEFGREKRRADEVGQQDTIMLSNIDSRGRLQDIGTTSTQPVSQGHRKREKFKVEKDTHDEHGNRIRYSAAEDKLGLNDLIMQERMASAHDYDDVMASRIAGDTTFKNDLDYIDDSADRFSQKKGKTEEQKRARAVQDFRRNQTAQQKCPFCFQDDQKPRAQIAALGNKTYLAMPEVISMVPGHCLIVPMDHALTTLECDDDTWDEIRNFQKCLIQMFAKENRGVLFMEQVINFKWRKHTVIECIPVPMDKWEDAPAYFKEAILSSEEEWSQHQKVIETGKREGGFRRSM
ncbi:hypothetical protein HK097_005015, partial [Rhizophlyctis rosea]